MVPNNFGMCFLACVRPVLNECFLSSNVLKINEWKYLKLPKKSVVVGKVVTYAPHKPL